MKEWEKKQREFEQVKARAKALKLRLTCTICGAKPKTLLNCPCGTTQYCSTDCQRIDWRDRGHRKACKKIRNERAAEAARAEAPPSPPKEVFYGPAPRSHADEVRARIAAEHEAARARREANPEREPLSARFGSCCPICLEEWDVNATNVIRLCCCRLICQSCEDKIGSDACPLCRVPRPKSAEALARLRRHVEADVPEAIFELANSYEMGRLGLVKSAKKAAKIYKRGVELGSVRSMIHLGNLYLNGGGGVKCDEKKTMQLWKTAAERGNAMAQAKLSTLVMESDPNEALRWMNLAAQQGYTLAESLLGGWLLKGSPGVEADLDESKRWLARAAAKGDRNAIKLLDILVRRHP